LLAPAHGCFISHFAFSSISFSSPLSSRTLKVKRRAGNAKEYRIKAAEAELASCAAPPAAAAAASAASWKRVGVATVLAATAVVGMRALQNR
jgi:hypothetical protein